MRLLSDDQLRNEDLKAQQSLISNLDRSLEKAKDPTIGLSFFKLIVKGFLQDNSQLFQKNHLKKIK